MRSMSLARAWRRQLLGASTAALIVPSAMLAALLALAISGAFSQVGVLGQLFVGPSLPVAGAGSGAGSGSGAAASGFAAVSLPVIPASGSVLRVRSGVAHHAPAGRPVLTASRGTGVAGGAIGGTGGTVTRGIGGSGGGSGGSGGGSAGSGGSGGSAGAGSSPGTGSSSPPPHHQPTPVDTAITVVTSVTQQAPAPVGPVVTQAVQTAGSVVDNLIPQTGQP
jgi:hypothetical protein